jgi:Arc/MetJ-type ribon-helix-helix transcriptional regulator
MTTVNLSLTTDQLNWIDKSSAKFGFANRSEFVRSLLRFLSQREDLLPSAQTFPFISPSTANKNEVLTSFQKTGKYSKKFMADLQAGLDRSDFFK